MIFHSWENCGRKISHQPTRKSAIRVLRPALAPISPSSHYLLRLLPHNCACLSEIYGKFAYLAVLREKHGVDALRPSR